MAYRLSVPDVSGVGVVHVTITDLLDHVKEIVEGDDDVTLTIKAVEMTPEEIAALPEFEGY